jgi:RNA polymerase sigma factor (sigma-70 family)
MSTLSEHIASITPRLQKLAVYMTNGDTFRADDLLQNAMVRILTTCNDETDEHIIYLRAKSAMLHTVRAEATYNRVVSTEATLATYSEDDNPDVWENVSSKQLTPEDEIVHREEFSQIKKVVKQLSPANRKIVYALYVDMSPAEIARELGVSRAAISQRMTRISDKLVSLHTVTSVPASACL